MKFPDIGHIHWLLRRLSCMSPAEVVYRFQQSATTRLEAAGLLAVTAKQAPQRLASEAAYFAPEVVCKSAYLDEADRILAGNVPLFSCSEFSVGPTPSWNTDPLTGTTAPSGFGPKLPITNRQVVGDIKHIWELNRHLHLVRLAQAFLISRDHRYLSGLANSLSSWLDQCPPMRGPNWSSALELGIRLINWSLIWRMLGGWNSELFSLTEHTTLRQRWLDSIYAHCAFIRRHVSRHSSANNHLIGELAGLYAASRTWPCWPDSIGWSQFAKGELEREIAAQYTPDGVNREQATAYHVFATEFLVLAGIYGSITDDPFTPSYWGSLNRAQHFLEAIRNASGDTPMFGDADDGIVWRLEPKEGENRPDQLLSLLNTLFGDSRTITSDTARWLTGNLARDIAPRFATDKTANSWSFPEGGYLIFGSNFGSPEEIKGIVDCGALGYLGIAAHGHADALSLVLSVNGQECLVDPGTFSYWNELKWRDYFRGTSAHNTLRVDGVDQSVSGGRFMWTRKANCAIRSAPTSPELFEFSGSHDGYERLEDAVTHRRNVWFSSTEQRLEVEDSARGNSEHLFEQFWHFAPDIRVTPEGTNSAEIAGKNFKIHVTFLGDNLALDMYRASLAPILGWHSSGYEFKSPTTTLRISARARHLKLKAIFKIQSFVDC